MRVHIMGASGSGVTTLGVRLSRRLGVPSFDTDSYFWLPTDPPFTTKRPEGERVRLLEAELKQCAGWVLSGSLMGWGDVFIQCFNLVVFLYVPPEVRMTRLMERERERYGDALYEMPMADIHKEFMAWAGRYDDPSFSGRSLYGHRAWLTRLDCSIVEIQGTPSIGESVERTMAAVASLGPAYPQRRRTNHPNPVTDIQSHGTARIPSGFAATGSRSPACRRWPPQSFAAPPFEADPDTTESA